MEEHSEEARRIVDVLLPCLQRKYKNGRWIYNTSYGEKNIVELKELIDNVLEHRI